MAWYNIFENGRQLLKRRQSPKDENSLLANVDLQTNDVKRDKEHGASGTNIYGGNIQWDDYNPQMSGDKLFDNIEQMRKADGAIKSALSVVKMPLLRTGVQIVVEDSDDTDAQNLLIAETCQEKLLAQGSVHEPWDLQLRNFLLMFDFGFSVAEKVYDVDEEGFLIFKRIAPRLPKTIRNWRVNSDGSLKYIEQEATKGGQQRTLKIPAPDYAVAMTWDREGDNYWGQSLLRPMYKHWWYKEQLYRIDAIRLDKWGVGQPDASIAEGYELKPKDRQDLIKMLQGMRGSERAFSLHPEAIKLSVLTPAGNGGGTGNLGLIDSVNHHDVMIFRSILAGFMTTGNQSYGNYGSTKSYADLFLFAEQAAANFIQNEYGRQVIKPFCDRNFEMGKRAYPQLKFADVQKIDMQMMAQSIASFTSANVIRPDDDLEAFFRKFFGWPKIQKGWDRKSKPDVPKATPQAFGKPVSSTGGAPNKPSSGSGRHVAATPVAATDPEVIRALKALQDRPESDPETRKLITELSVALTELVSREQPAPHVDIRVDAPVIPDPPKPRLVRKSVERDENGLIKAVIEEEIPNADKPETINPGS